MYDDGNITTSIDPRVPAGKISLQTPASTDTTYIKIGEYATFEWEYQSVSVTPKKLNIQAFCSYNSETYTLATSYSSSETSYVWDTEEFQANATVPLLTAQYTLQIYDSSKNMSAIASPGYLAPFSQKFAMYSPQAYTPMAQYSCVNCKKNDGSILDPTVAKWVYAMIVLFLASTLQTMIA